MSVNKADEIKAWNEFIDTVGKDGAINSYFTELIEARERVVSNIQNDFPAITGVFISKLDHEKLRMKAMDLKEKLVESEEWDARKLRARRQEIWVSQHTVQHQLETVQDFAKDLEAELDAVNEKINGSLPYEEHDNDEA